MAWTNDLERLAAATGMREFVARAYLHRARLGDASAIDAARVLAEDIDNRLLHDLVGSHAVAARTNHSSPTQSR